MTTFSGKVKSLHTPCPHEGCNSSDGYVVYEDGGTKCYSCGTYVPPKSVTREKGTTYQTIPHRGITAETLLKYNVYTEVSADGTPFRTHFPFSPNASKIRSWEGKDFRILGGEAFRQAGLFGQNLFNGGGDSVVINEGLHDALATWQMLKVPSVSVKSATQAIKDCRNSFEWLNSFKKIYLALDNDVAGKEAAQGIAALFPYNKVFLIQMTTHKDSNEYLIEGQVKEFRAAFKNAKHYTPESIVSSYADLELSLDERPRTPLCTLPFPSLQEKLDGFGAGEVILISGLEGIGKTEVLRAFEHHVLANTDYNVGVVHLEEQTKDVVNGLASYFLETPLKRSDTAVTKDEIMGALKNLTSRDGRLHVYKPTDSESPLEIVEVIRNMISVCECKFIFFDHINIAVSQLSLETDERRTIDFITTRLARMTESLGANLVMITHVNDDGLTRGSRNTSKVAHVHIGMERDIDSANPVVRNRIDWTVKKNRPTQATGPLTAITYNEEKGILEEFVNEGINYG